MKTIKWGIIGCGDVTEIKSGPAFNKVEGSELVAVMRRDAEKVRDYAERHHVARYYTDAQELIDDPEVNAIYVATPPAYHEDYTIRALRAGKPVYVEKPVSLTAASASRMDVVSRETGVSLSAAHYRRALPLFKTVKELLDSKAIGEPRLVNLELLQTPNTAMVTRTEDNWRTNPAISGGGLFHDLAPHQLDLMLLFFGPVKQSSGLSVNQSRSYDAADLVCGQIAFEGGVIFNGIWSFNVPPTSSRDVCEIIGSTGSLRFATFGNYVEINTANGWERTTFEHPQHIQQPMIEEVVRFFRGDAPNPCTAAEAVTVMAMMDSFS